MSGPDKELDLEFALADMRQERDALLEACKAVLPYVHKTWCDPHPLGQCELCHNLEAAITKAEGRG